VLGAEDNIRAAKWLFLISLATMPQATMLPDLSFITTEFHHHIVTSRGGAGRGREGGNSAQNFLSLSQVPLVVQVAHPNSLTQENQWYHGSLGFDGLGTQATSDISNPLK
jgi:hypothetical protein